MQERWELRRSGRELAERDLDPKSVQLAAGSSATDRRRPQSSATADEDTENAVHRRLHLVTSVLLLKQIEDPVQALRPIRLFKEGPTRPSRPP